MPATPFEGKTMKIKCLLVDDEPLALDALESLIQKIPELEIAGRCQNAVEALQAIHHQKIDLLLLDIQMPELTGIEMLKSLSHPPSVIFTTAYREYAVEAFELDVIDYLVKPISLDRLIRSINRYHDRHSQKSGTRDTVFKSLPKTITIYSDKKNYRVQTSSILFIEGLKDYARVHTDHGRLVTRQTMKNMEEILPSEEFIRVHRSFIVPVHRLDSWTSYAVTVKDKEIPVGRTYRKTVLNLLANMREIDQG
jgi:DNA-binding LytR/AlgR family response regulator